MNYYGQEFLVIFLKDYKIKKTNINDKIYNFFYCNYYL